MAYAAGIVLAAGAGRRLGRAKALLRLGDQLLVERAVAVLREAGCEPVIAVLGAQAAEVQATADLRGAAVVVNAGWDSGMGSSLQSGLRALVHTGAQAAVVILVDLPGITAEAVRRLAVLAAPDALASATYQGKRGHPVLLGRSHWEAICALDLGDRGARDYLRTHEVRLVACEDVAGDADIDTGEDARVWGIRG